MTQRLATYGTLGPGRSNHHYVEALGGRWIDGTVRGRLLAIGWGAAQGFPGIVLDDAADVVAVEVLESDALEAAWPRLDAFEGRATPAPWSPSRPPRGRCRRTSTPWPTTPYAVPAPPDPPTSAPPRCRAW